MKQITNIVACIVIPLVLGVFIIVGIDLANDNKEGSTHQIEKELNALRKINEQQKKDLDALKKIDDNILVIADTQMFLCSKGITAVYQQDDRAVNDISSKVRMNKELTTSYLEERQELLKSLGY